MKRRSVQNDPIRTSERDRGVIFSRLLVNLEKATPAATESEPQLMRPR